MCPKLCPEVNEETLRSQVRFLESLFYNFTESAHEHIARETTMKKQWGSSYGNKNCGKTALKRKITLLRQELLNLEEMICRE